MARSTWHQSCDHGVGEENHFMKKTIQLLLLAISLEFSVYAQVPWPDPAHLASSELSNNASIITNWLPYVVGHHVVVNSVLSLPEVYKNIGFADVNGDGYPDLCFLDTVLNEDGWVPGPNPDGTFNRAYSATPILKCALGWLASPFNIQFAAPTVWDADAHGFLLEQPPSTWGQFDESIQFVDLNGDGKADACSVWASHAAIKCVASNGSSFVNTGVFVQNTKQMYGSEYADTADAVRFVDLNHDGKTDVCMRVPTGMKCALSDGSNFGQSTLWSADFSDSNGWGASPAYWSTIQFGDLNGDGLPDVCGRSPAGITCAINNGQGFLRSWLWTTQFSDAAGWNQPQYYSTIRLADVNGDGRADVCGRGSAGIYCARSGGVFFGDPWTLRLPEFSDANGWNQEPSYRSLWLVDVNNDGRADVCGRGTLGIWCALSTASFDPSFSPSQLTVSNFGDNYSWGTQDYYWSTVRPIHGSPQQVPMTAFCGRGGAGIWCSSFFFRPTL